MSPYSGPQSPLVSRPVSTSYDDDEENKNKGDDGPPIHPFNTLLEANEHVLGVIFIQFHLLEIRKYMSILPLTGTRLHIIWSNLSTPTGISAHHLDCSA